MKNINKFLLVAAIAASFTFVNRASAGGNGTPRTQQEQIRTVPGGNNDPDLLKDHSYRNAPPKTVQMRQESAVAQNVNSHRDPNLLNQYAAVPGTPKEKDQALDEFEIAPLK